MAIYKVNNGIIGEEISIDDIKTMGLINDTEIVIQYRNAMAYRTASPESKIEAVRIYEAPGDNFAGKSISC